MSKQQEESAIKWGKIFKIFLLILAALIIGVVVFFVFKIHIDAKDALREAKNVKLALGSVDIEMYAKDKSVFDPSNKNGLEEGVKDKVKQYVTVDGTYKLTNYSYRKREITGMIYEKDHYIVTYIKDGEDVYWDVDYKLNVYHFDDAEE